MAWGRRSPVASGLERKPGWGEAVRIGGGGLAAGAPSGPWSTRVPGVLCIMVPARTASTVLQAGEFNKQVYFLERSPCAL